MSVIDEYTASEPISVKTIAGLATMVWADWGEKVNYAARPYLEAMDTISSIDEMYYYDTADSVVRYFLSNATTWRGETAKAVKAELKRRLA